MSEEENEHDVNKPEFVSVVFRAVRKAQWVNGLVYRPGQATPPYTGPEHEQMQFFERITNNTTPVDTPPGAPPLPSVKANRMNVLLEALASLNRDNNNHWTSTGTPRIAYIEQITRLRGITQAELRDLDPEHYLRTQPR